MKLQKLNELITGTNHCGPRTSGNKRTVSDLDVACRAHDLKYARLDNPYFSKSAANRDFLADLEEVKVDPFRNPRQYLTKQIAQLYFGTIETLPIREARPKRRYPDTGERLKRIKDDLVMEGVTPEAAPTRDRIVPNSKRIMPYVRKVAGRSRGRKTAKAPYRRRRAPSKPNRRAVRKRRTGSRKAANRFNKRVVKALAATQKTAPLWNQVTGYGQLFCSANKDTWHVPYAFLSHETSKADDYVLWMYDAADTIRRVRVNISFDADFTNLSSHVLQMTVYRWSIKKKSLFPQGGPATFHDIDAANDPANAGDYTDNYKGFDMNKVLGAFTAGSTTYCPDGDDSLDCVHDITKTPTMQGNLKLKKIHDFVMQPNGVVTIHPRFGAFMCTSGMTSAVASSAQTWTLRKRGLLFKIKAFPLKSNTAGEYVGSNSGFIGFKYSRKTRVVRVDVNAPQSNIRPILYLSNGNATQTDYALFSANRTEVDAKADVLEV